MTDIVDSATRSRNMAAIPGKNSRPELTVRRFLHRAGLRFRLHCTGMPGTPDIVLPRWRAVVFVHGCFWHRHDGCRLTTTPRTRADFWQQKFDTNVRRDAAQQAALAAAGWRVFVVWECETAELRNLEDLVTRIQLPA